VPVEQQVLQVYKVLVVVILKYSVQLLPLVVVLVEPVLHLAITTGCPVALVAVVQYCRFPQEVQVVMQHRARDLPVLVHRPEAKDIQGEAEVVLLLWAQPVSLETILLVMAEPVQHHLSQVQV
jgi:hypothetical protein